MINAYRIVWLKGILFYILLFIMFASYVNLSFAIVDILKFFHLPSLRCYDDQYYQHQDIYFSHDKFFYSKNIEGKRLSFLFALSQTLFFFVIFLHMYITAQHF